MSSPLWLLIPQEDEEGAVAVSLEVGSGQHKQFSEDGAANVALDTFGFS